MLAALGFLILWILEPLHSADGKKVPAFDVPKSHDDRLVVELYAAAPDIVHPIGMDFDSKGRLLVIESHTHFRPENYKGPKYDRIRILEDTTGTGKANRFTTFYEGTVATMDIAAHPDGSIYLATRNEIIRLRDTKGDGKAHERRRIAFLETKGDYPHNGLAGLCFDSRGDLYFGMGENLGAGYKLVGADGTTIADGGEGGNIFWCTADGKNLRRVATGFWNPFGVGRDIFGCLFAVDNDPDSRPPCRMVHVAEGGDYGFQFRYGRSGKHPFQAWDGELPGTLPMVSGTGEAPCEVLSYESDGLPREYLGSLLVTAWADHRVERYLLKERGASFSAEPKPFIDGGQDFRPTGLAVAPDGSLFVGDWVLKDYHLHNRGAVWHIRPRAAQKPMRPSEPRQALFSLHRPLRESAARRLAADDSGRDFLRQQLKQKDVRIRAAALIALRDARDDKTPWRTLATGDPKIGIRALAVAALVARKQDVKQFLDKKEHPALRLEAIASLGTKADAPELLDILIDPDPFLRNAAIHQLARASDVLAAIDVTKVKNAMVRQGLLLAHRASGRPESMQLLPVFLGDTDQEIRFLAAKWIADRNLTQFRALMAEALKDRKLNIRMYTAYATALARIDNRPVNEANMADYFFDRLADEQAPLEVRLMALRLIPPTHKKLTLGFLKKLLDHKDPAWQREAIRALNEHPDPKRMKLLREVADDTRLVDEARALAIVGLSEKAPELSEELVRIAESDHASLRNEALRSLINTKLKEDHRTRLEEVARLRPEAADLVARVLGTPFAKERPAPADLETWLKRLEGPADADAGRRIFAHGKIASCHRCHRIEGRGQDIGPDLSTIGQRERRFILESILQPSNQIAPQYQTWLITFKNGTTRTGLLVGTNLDEYTYLDEKGTLFKLNTRDVDTVRPISKSIMPDGLADLMTDQEIRDLMAYLTSLK